MILHGGTKKFFGTLICFFRSFISFFRTFISRFRGEFSFAPWRIPISSVEIQIFANFQQFRAQDPYRDCLGTEEFLPWNLRVPALKLRSSKVGTFFFATPMYNKISTLRSFVRADSLHSYDSLFGYALMLARYWP